MLTAAEIEEWNDVDQYEDDPIDRLTERAVKAERELAECRAMLEVARDEDRRAEYVALSAQDWKTPAGAPEIIAALKKRAVKAEQQRDELLRVLRFYAFGVKDDAGHKARAAIAKIEGEGNATNTR